MCGINVLISPDSSAPKLLEQMMLRTAHRGPDGNGACHIEGKIHLGANRLKVLDLSQEADMPFWSSCGQYVLVWNGAIYNYKALKKTLMSEGHQFRTESDTEVLLYWLVYKGTSEISSLNGMFAFALADLAKQELWVGRDSSGEKPLYFQQTHGNWIFSSESKGVAAALECAPSLNNPEFASYFYYRFTSPNSSFFEGISQLIPGTGMIISFDGTLNKKFEWTASRELAATPDFSWEGLLKKAVVNTIHTDRQVGMILSGGVDSSLLYALYYEQYGKPLPTFTAAVENRYRQKYNDPQFAKRFHDKYPADHHEITITFQDVQENWECYIKSVDQPIGDSAGFMSWMIGKEAKPHATVLLSGAGADELFGGYTRHEAFDLILRFPKLFSLLKGLGRFLPFSFPIERLLAAVKEDPSETFIQMAALAPMSLPVLNQWKMYYPKGKDPYLSALNYDRKVYLANDVLRLNDNVFMSHGIEMRAPYLDGEILGAIEVFPERQREEKGKKWIKTALEQRGLAFIAHRKKKGFGLPLLEWTREKQYLNWICGPIIEMEKKWGEFFPEPMRILAANPQKAKPEQFLILFNLFVLATWMQKQNL
jgi:asparagine synthase (glutamine-hydrolysing)